MTPTKQLKIIDHETGEIVPVEKDRVYYASNLNALHSQATRLGVHSGNMLIEAKASLDHGEFEAMINNDLPYGTSTAQILMAIARHPELSKADHGQLLPQSWRTQYELTKLPAPILKEKLDSGEINPNTTRKEARAMHTTARNLDALMTSQSEEWYTTPDIINLAIAAMGGIDLDPCSNSHEDPNVPATYHFTKEDDSLSQNWLGRVYMNPPYGTAIPHWISKVIEEYEAGHVSKAVVLVPSRTDTRWFRMLKKYPRCFMWGRVRFNNHTNSAPFPTMLVGLGIDIDHFKKVMEDTGDVYAIV